MVLVRSWAWLGLDSFGEGRLAGDILWNLGALGMLAASGIALNVVVGASYGAETLGLFNQVFAAYLLLSQLACGGVHYSTLRYVAQHSADPKRLAAIVRAALGTTLILSALATACGALLAESIGRWLESDGVGQGMLWMLPGLFFYGLNKVLFAVLNGERRMRAYAVVNGLRPLLWLAVIVLAPIAGWPGEMLPVAFTVEGFLVFIVAFALVWPRHRGGAESLAPWLAAHARFGGKSFLGGALIEINTRVDVLMLGWFASDAVVGIYSFAALWVEGLTQLLYVLRNQANPILVRLIAAEDWVGLRRFVARGKLATYAGMAAVGAMAVAAYPLLADWFLEIPEPRESWLVFAILMGGVVLGSGYFPFGGLLLQAGRPGLHTSMLLAAVLSNALLNLLLIPAWSAAGAATATAISFWLSAPLLVRFTRHTVGVRI